LGTKGLVEDVSQRRELGKSSNDCSQ